MKPPHTPEHLLENGRRIRAARQRRTLEQRQALLAERRDSAAAEPFIIPPDALDTAAALGVTADGLGAILRALGVRQEWAVPCLGDACRELHGSREEAEAAAVAMGGVVERRLATSWRPQNAGPPLV